MEPRTERGGWMTGLIAGGLAGLLLAGGVGGASVFAIAKYRERKERRRHESWSLTPVIVFNQDLPAGTQIQFDLISQRTVPEQFVTASAVKPSDAETLVGARLAQPVRSGDLATWQGLADGKTEEGLVKVREWAAQADPARAKLIRDTVKLLEPAGVGHPP